MLLAAWGLALVAGCVRPAEARDRAYRKLLHRTADYHILVIKGKHPDAALARLCAHPSEFRIVVWQSPPEESTPERIQPVLNWVRQGGVVWFQDSRLASAFSLQPAPVHRGDLRQVKLHKGDYGDIRKQPGAATLATVPRPPHHGVLTRVTTVPVFLPEVGPDAYSAVHAQANLTPLLVLETDAAKPLADRVIAGISPLGKGSIVFKPLIFDEHLSGERFQGNLLEYSAGFAVPGAAPSGLPAASQP
jgi:hypothetical protein